MGRISQQGIEMIKDGNILHWIQINNFEKTYAHFLFISWSERDSGKTSAHAQRIWRVEESFMDPA